MRDYARLCKALRHCATHFSCDGCGGKCSTSSNEPRTKSVITDAADAIEELLASVPHWISVEDELPEFHMNDSGCVCTRNVVFRTEHKTVHLGYVIRTAHNIETVGGFEQILMDRWHDQTGDMIEGVTHWMPIPEAPKEVERWLTF